jgi:DNA-binding winged helix-turn-helix (wHTH) protein
MNGHLMKPHKRFLVWAQINEQSQTWRLAGESDDWSHASNLAISCLDRSEVTDVMINEFIPLELTDGRDITFHIQSVAHIEEDQFSTGVFLDKRSGMVFVDGKAKILSSSEHALLSLLYERDNEIVSKSDITIEVWHEEFIPHRKSNARIEQLISRLRRRVESDPSNPKFILNMRERGYTLNKEGKH